MQGKKVILDGGPFGFATWGREAGTSIGENWYNEYGAQNFRYTVKKKGGEKIEFSHKTLKENKCFDKKDLTTEQTQGLPPRIFKSMANLPIFFGWYFQEWLGENFNIPAGQEHGYPSVDCEYDEESKKCQIKIKSPISYAGYLGQMEFNGEIDEEGRITEKNLSIELD